MAMSADITTSWYACQPQCGSLWYNISSIALKSDDLMDSNEFIKIRQNLDKTQVELARILCVSAKAIQSFEQGWRKIPTHVERQLLLLLSLKRIKFLSTKPCWETINCPYEHKINCIVWELKIKHFCWFMNGTFCQGKVHKNWGDKIKICKDCEVYQSS
ncbi:helix-turn-helix domain-containing protein [Chloroflexota bacterium]